MLPLPCMCACDASQLICVCGDVLAQDKTHNVEYLHKKWIFSWDKCSLVLLARWSVFCACTVSGCVCIWCAHKCASQLVSIFSVLYLADGVCGGKYRDLSAVTGSDKLSGAEGQLSAVRVFCFLMRLHRLGTCLSRLNSGGCCRKGFAEMKAEPFAGACVHSCTSA